MSAEGWIGVATGVMSSVICAAISYGVQSEKIRQTEKDVKDLRDLAKEFVTYKYFDAVILPMSKTIDNIQQGIKELLRKAN